MTYQNLTWLPVQELCGNTSLSTALLVGTPHRGTVTIDLTETVATGFFLFGNIAKGNKEASRIINEIKRLEAEADKYLRDSWIYENPELINN
jgi:hypothetical protein